MKSCAIPATGAWLGTRVMVYDNPEDAPQHFIAADDASDVSDDDDAPDRALSTGCETERKRGKPMQSGCVRAECDIATTAWKTRFSAESLKTRRSGNPVLRLLRKRI